MSCGRRCVKNLSFQSDSHICIEAEPQEARDHCMQTNPRRENSLVLEDSFDVSTMTQQQLVICPYFRQFAFFLSNQFQLQADGFVSKRGIFESPPLTLFYSNSRYQFRVCVKVQTKLKVLPLHFEPSQLQL